MTTYLEATKAQTEYLCHTHVVGAVSRSVVLACGVRSQEHEAAGATGSLVSVA